MRRFRTAVMLAAAGLLLTACGSGAPEPQAVEASPATASNSPRPAPEQPPTEVPAPAPPPALSATEQEQLDRELIAAAKANNAPLVAGLIGRGGNVNARDAIQDSAYLFAGAEGFNEVLRLTLAAGADVASTNRYGGTALIPASEHGHVETVQILIAAGVPVNHVNNLGWTAMQEAILLNNGGPRQLAVVRLLLEAGADPDIRDPEGRTALQNSERLGFAEIAALIRSRS
ncbi:ankyrin repeat domain-containing protein [Pseudarthrobacter oxydans]|uniref:ankyrin repeat domain-containing protein n=1 Tax=Pseudarthrobacter oxydans TaxID=1671 RepID=UPI00344B6042